MYAAGESARNLLSIDIVIREACFLVPVSPSARSFVSMGAKIAFFLNEGSLTSFGRLRVRATFPFPRKMSAQILVVHVPVMRSRLSV